MNPTAEFHGKDVANEGPRSDLIMLGVMAPLAGLGAGLVGALFRLALEQANRFRDALIARMDVWGVGGFVLFVALAAGAAAIAAWLVRCIAPSASGSGIPRVMAVLDGEVAPAPLRVITVKFLAGTLYNRTLLATLRATDRLSGLPVELRAGIVGAAVGAVAWFAPSLVGEGDGLAQQALSGEGTLAVLPVLFLLRLGLIACSVAAGAPGGLLVPFLALGAELGLWLGLLCALAFPGMALEPQGFALVGMAALFTAIVRAPLTAIVLVAEMTANLPMLLPMIVACFAAMLVSTLFGDMSILDSLKERLLLRTNRTARDVHQ